MYFTISAVHPRTRQFAVAVTQQLFFNASPSSGRNNATFFCASLCCCCWAHRRRHSTHNRRKTMPVPRLRLRNCYHDTNCYRDRISWEIGEAREARWRRKALPSTFSTSRICRPIPAEEYSSPMPDGNDFEDRYTSTSTR